jgi:hypothetical protein
VRGNTIVNVFVSLCKQIANFSRPCLLTPQQSTFLFNLTFTSNTTMLQFATDVYLHTNTSVFKIPIYVYHGRLKVTDQNLCFKLKSCCFKRFFLIVNEICSRAVCSVELFLGIKLYGSCIYLYIKLMLRLRWLVCHFFLHSPREKCFATLDKLICACG